MVLTIQCSRTWQCRDLTRTAGATLRRHFRLILLLVEMGNIHADTNMGSTDRLNIDYDMFPYDRTVIKFIGVLIK